MKNMLIPILRELKVPFTNSTKFNDVKELDCPLFEGLFD